jgi:serine protease Do
VRCGRLTIGETTYDNPLVLVRMEQHGMLQFGGLLGLPVIQTLDMAFDRRRRSFAVRRNGLEPGGSPYGLSGLWLNEERGRVVVSEVGVGSPAAAVGIQAGDVVEGVANLRAALDRLQGEAGQPVELSLVRNGAAVSARFELRAYL